MNSLHALHCIALRCVYTAVDVSFVGQLFNGVCVQQCIASSIFLSPSVMRVIVGEHINIVRWCRDNISISHKMKIHWKSFNVKQQQQQPSVVNYPLADGLCVSVCVVYLFWLNRCQQHWFWLKSLLIRFDRCKSIYTDTDTFALNCTHSSQTIR